MITYPYGSKRTGAGIASRQMEAKQDRLLWGRLMGLAVILPAVLYPHQLPAGVAVNFALVFAAYRTRGWLAVLPLVTLPSLFFLGAVGTSGDASAALIWMLPGIWIGNAALVWLVRRLSQSKSLSIPAVVLCAAAGKTVIIYCAAMTAVMWQFMPHWAAATIVPLQMATALAGGIAAAFAAGKIRLR